jgi:hypothetical protein
MTPTEKVGGSLIDPKVRRKIRRAGPPPILDDRLREWIYSYVASVPMDGGAGLMAAVEAVRYICALNFPRKKVLNAMDMELIVAGIAPYVHLALVEMAAKMLADDLESP